VKNPAKNRAAAVDAAVRNECIWNITCEETTIVARGYER